MRDFIISAEMAKLDDDLVADAKALYDSLFGEVSSKARVWCCVFVAPCPASARWQGAGKGKGDSKGASKGKSDNKGGNGKGHKRPSEATQEAAPEWKKHKQAQGQASGYSGKKCFNCQQKGHIAADCRQPKKQN